MQDFLLKMSIILVPGLLAITCHEVSHGVVAYKFGDKTAHSQGRLTLNPLKHLDFLGTLMLLIFHFGWAKPVPVILTNLKNPKRDMVWIAIAGPATNFLLAILSAIALRSFMLFVDVIPVTPYLDFKQPIILMLAFSVYINLLLGFFNLIPIPPLDGGRITVGLLPYRQAVSYSKIEPYGFFIVIFLVFFPVTNIFSLVIMPLLMSTIKLLAGPQYQLVMESLSYIVSLPNFIQAFRSFF